MNVPPRAATRILLAGLVALALLAAGAAPAAAGLVRVGSAPGLSLGTRLLGPLADATPLRISVALRPRDAASLARYALAVATPGGPEYHRYLRPRQFATRFGATAAEVREVDAALRARGLTPGALSANALAVPVTASAGLLARAFETTFERVRLADGSQAVVNSLQPALDGVVAGDISAVIGLSSLDRKHPLGVSGSRRRPAVAAARPHVATGGPQPCGAASSAAGPQSAYTTDQIASAYDFAGQYRAGDEGQGVTVAVYELEPNSPQDIATYQACYGTHASVSYVPVDGGVGTGSGSGEAALDIEQVIGLAPRANVIVYQGPNSGSGAPGSGPYDTLAAIVDQDRAQVATISYGGCEPATGAAVARAEATLFEQAAVQGQSVFAASGDNGSEDCNGETLLPDAELAVDDPSSQPFVTGVGGTSLKALGPPPSETVWNNGPSLASLLGMQPGAGGGGVSSLWSMPAYQSAASGSLHVIQSSSGAPCGAPAGDCREVPDVSADADPLTGYLIYVNGSGSASGVPSGWQGIGGTSAGAPLWAALAALADASKACGGTPVGFVNPALYRAAGASYASVFHDVTSGNNDYAGVHGGRFTAQAGYDLATGLGTPDAARLGNALCADSLRLRNPGRIASPLRSSVHTTLDVTDARGQHVTLHALGLPPGLHLVGSSGAVSGKPSRRGTYTVRVMGSDASGALRGISFTWTVVPAPRLTALALSGIAARRPALSLRLTAARGASPFTVVTVHPPSGLRFASTSGISVTGAGGRRLRARDVLSHGVLTLRLATASSQASVTIASPAVLATSASRGSRRLSVSATDASGATSSLSGTLHPRS
jgi:hypothetical protein